MKKKAELLVNYVCVLIINTCYNVRIYSIVNVEPLDVVLDNEFPVNDDVEKAVTTSYTTNSNKKTTTLPADFILNALSILSLRLVNNIVIVTSTKI